MHIRIVIECDLDPDRTYPADLTQTALMAADEFGYLIGAHNITVSLPDAAPDPAVRLGEDPAID